VNGKTQVLDGPFADTKEQLGGYYLIDVRGSGRGVVVGGEVSGGEPRIGGGAGDLVDVTDGTPARAIPLDNLSGRCIFQIDYAKPDRLRDSRTAFD
jgi:hypothetical protein